MGFKEIALPLISRCIPVIPVQPFSKATYCTGGESRGSTNPQQIKAWDARGVPYKAYLASREWALKREAVRRRGGNKCERCKTGPQDAVHHLTYANVGNEPLEDLQAICNPCHEFLSGKSNFDPAAKDDGRTEFYEKYTGVNPPSPAFRTINYGKAYCDNCQEVELFVFRDVNMSDWPFGKFDNCIDSNGELKTSRFWLHCGQAYCDRCGEDIDVETFAYLVRL